jgi:hypothetical protein
MMLWGSKFWFENRKAYFLYLLALAGLLFVWQSIFLAFRNPNLFSERTQLSQYIVLLYFAGCLSANYLFTDLREKPKSIAYLLTPVSAVEKLLVTLFFGIPVFFVGFNVAFYSVDALMVYMGNNQNATHFEVFNVLTISEFENPFINDSNSAYLLYVYFPVQSFFILGAIYFRKFSLVKTCIVLFGVWIFVVLLQVLLAGILPVGDFSAMAASYRVMDADGLKIIHLPGWLHVTSGLFFKFLVVPIFWLAAYFRLREKQVA